MTAHALIELIKYKWHAKTRHGIHSPFVYDFIASLIYKKKLHPLKGNSFYHQQLLTLIANHYGSTGIYSLTDEVNTENAKPGLHDLIWLNISDTERWKKTFESNLPLLNPNSIIAISNIHKTEKHTVAWESLYKSDKVKLSMDLYGIGLLFFKEEFKQKQHFIIKYP